MNEEEQSNYFIMYKRFSQNILPTPTFSEISIKTPVYNLVNLNRRWLASVKHRN